tara:strand:+ start:306 stop:455 length:150 start_codon:yes stop_codon:yes gene_type:complete
LKSTNRAWFDFTDNDGVLSALIADNVDMCAVSSHDEFAAIISQTLDGEV